MALQVPKQQRSVDPYSDNRFSQIINRFTRIVSSGKNLILFPDDSFKMIRYDWGTVKITPGVFVKDDVLIHITEDFYLNLTDNESYIDGIGMDREGYYYLVIKYSYVRSLPAPQATYRIFKNRDKWEQYENNYVFLGCLNIVWNNLEKRFQISTANGDLTNGGALPGMSATVPNGYPLQSIWDLDPTRPEVCRVPMPNIGYFVDGGWL